ncbi:MAG TPA: YdeI/OmpD-associated family protein [Ohtaekwangia sp.]|nr:YdeI/OmpD-associated family protein [Ohtaekwangia sp.]
MTADLMTRLGIKPHHAVLVRRSPAELGKMLQTTTLPVKGKYDAVVLFVRNQADIDKFSAGAIGKLKEDALFWVAYPKKSAAQTDITRDKGWNAITGAGFKAVAIIAVDQTWSALRFRPAKPVKSNVPATVQRFQAVLEKPDDGMDTAFITVPFDVQQTYGTKGRVKVKALFDGYPYRGILVNMGTGGHIIIVRKDVRQAIGKKAGDSVNVEIRQDTDERVVDVPESFERILKKHPEAKRFFDTLSYTNRKEYAAWIRDAKKEETREKRLKAAVEKLMDKKKNPFVK